MNILIIGYGKMGKAIENCLLSRGHIIAGRIDPPSGMEWIGLDFSLIDCAIEFSTPETGPSNIKEMLTAGIPVVSGTTGWLSHLDEVKDLVNQKQGAFVYGSNFSPGVNVLFRLNSLLANWMNGMSGYDCMIEERHHRYKKDAPGGTALSLADQVVENNQKMKRWGNEELSHRAIHEDEISMAWLRGGSITGDHTVSWTSATDEISISHKAFNREGFAMGAVMAAEWIKGKKGFYNFTDIFKEII